MEIRFGPGDIIIHKARAEIRYRIRSIELAREIVHCEYLDGHDAGYVFLNWLDSYKLDKETKFNEQLKELIND